MPSRPATARASSASVAEQQPCLSRRGGGVTTRSVPSCLRASLAPSSRSLDPLFPLLCAFLRHRRSDAHEDADALVALLLEQSGGDGRIDAAGHRHDDFAVSRHSGIVLRSPASAHAAESSMSRIRVENRGASPSSQRAVYTVSPPMTVRNTRVWGISRTSQVMMSRSMTMKSANLPGASEPFCFSSNAA